MNKFLLKALVLASVNIAFLGNAQFRTQDRMDRLEDFDQKKVSWGFYLNANMIDYKIVLDPRYGILRSSRAPCKMPSSPNLPCIAI